MGECCKQAHPPLHMSLQENCQKQLTPLDILPADPPDSSLNTCQYSPHPPLVSIRLLPKDFRCILFKTFLTFIYFREEGEERRGGREREGRGKGKGEREREISIGCLLHVPQTTQVCALISNQTHDLSVHGTTLQPSHTCQGSKCILYILNNIQQYQQMASYLSVSASHI